MEQGVNQRLSLLFLGYYQIEAAFLDKLKLAKQTNFPRLNGSFEYMSFGPFNQILALSPPAQSGQSQPPMWTGLMPLVLLFVMFYFVLLRPQQKKQKQHAELLKTVRPGDKIVTTGGVVAVVVTVKEKTLSIRSADSKFEITKAAIAEITERSAESTAS